MEKKSMSSQSKIKIFVKFKVKQMNIRERMKERNKNDFEILQRFGNEPSAYDRSNLPPVILPSIPQKMRASNENSRMVMETLMIQNLIQSYFAIVKKNIADLVPKTIMAFLVN